MTSITQGNHRNFVDVAGVIERRKVATTSNGKPVVTLHVASTIGKYTEKIRVVCWQELADQVTAEFQDGDYIRARGRLHSYRFQDEKGQWVGITEVTARVLGSAADEKPGMVQSTSGVEIGDADIPF